MEDLKRRQVEEETGDHSTRTTRRIAQGLPEPSGPVRGNGIIKQLTKAMIERCLQSEMEEHLGYPKHGRKPPKAPISAMD